MEVMEAREALVETPGSQATSHPRESVDRRTSQTRPDPGMAERSPAPYTGQDRRLTNSIRTDHSSLS